MTQKEAHNSLETPKPPPDSQDIYVLTKKGGSFPRFHSKWVKFQAAETASMQEEQESSSFL